MNKNYLADLINELIKINPNDDLKISKSKFYKNEVVKEIVYRYNFNNKTKSKIYMLIGYLLRVSNKTYSKNKELAKRIEIDNITFENLKLIKSQNMELLGNAFINYFNYKIKYNAFKRIIEIIVKINFPAFFWNHERENIVYLDSKIGGEFHKYGLCDKEEFVIADLAYTLNENGKKFLNAIFTDPTEKENTFYSNIVDYNVMSEYKTAKTHREYYKQVMNKINIYDNSVKVARLHNKKFKEFFEEYDPLIKYVTVRYGENTLMRFCGFETNQKIKCDGKVFVEGREEKIEITSSFFDDKSVAHMKELNHYGVATQSGKFNSIEIDIFNKVSESIKSKIEKDSYDNTVTLVVLFNEFRGMFSDKIGDIGYLRSIFIELTKKEYIFKNVYVLVDKYEGSDIVIEPRLIKLK